MPAPAKQESIAAVRVVLPWSTWPIVPTFTWGFDLSNISAILWFSFKFIKVATQKPAALMEKLDYLKLFNYKHILTHTKNLARVAK